MIQRTSKIACALSIALCSVYSTNALSQTAAAEVQRNVNQQQRIEQGLQSGQLNTKEAARLERREAGVSRLQSRALADGKLNAAEKARIDTRQDAMSKDIAAEKHDAQKGNPQSASSQRMQADVQRNVNQQTRIENGIKSGQLNNKEVARLEAGQARVDSAEARAGRDGHVGAKEQAHIQTRENRNSGRIFAQKHDAQRR